MKKIYYLLFTAIFCFFGINCVKASSLDSIYIDYSKVNFSKNDIENYNILFFQEYSQFSSNNYSAWQIDDHTIEYWIFAGNTGYLTTKYYFSDENSGYSMSYCSNNYDMDIYIYTYYFDIETKIITSNKNYILNSYNRGCVGYTGKNFSKLDQNLYEIFSPILLYSKNQINFSHSGIYSNVTYDRSTYSDVSQSYYDYVLNNVLDIDFSFEYIYAPIPELSETNSKIGAKVNLNISNFDSKTMKILYSVDDNKIYTELFSPVYQFSFMKNFDLFVKVVDKIDNSIISSQMLSITQIVDPSLYLNISYEDVTSIDDMKEIDGENIYISSKMKVSFSHLYTDYWNYYCEEIPLGLKSGILYDLTDSIVENSFFHTFLKSGTLHCYYSDKNNNMIYENFSDTVFLYDKEKLGQYIFFDISCSLDKLSCDLMSTFLNFNSNSFIYFYSIDNGENWMNITEDISQNVYNKFLYTFYDNSNISFKVTDLFGKQVYFKSYSCTSISSISNDSDFKNSFLDSFSYFKRFILEIFYKLTYFYNSLTFELKSMYVLSFFFVIILCVFKFFL